MDLVRQAKELSELHPAAKWAPPVSSAGVCRSSAAAVELETALREEDEAAAAACDEARDEADALDANLGRLPVLTVSVADFNPHAYPNSTLESDPNLNPILLGFQC